MPYRKKTLRNMTHDQKIVARGLLPSEQATKALKQAVVLLGVKDAEIKELESRNSHLQMLVDRINSNGAHHPEPLFPTEEKELATAKVTAHCVNCDSENIVMYNAQCSWDDDRQEWVVDGGSDLMYQCSDCGFDKNDVVIKKENE